MATTSLAIPDLTTPRGQPREFPESLNAVLFYLSGISMNRIAFLLRVSAQAVLNWIRAFAIKHYKKPEPTGNTIVLELDEMMKCGITQEKTAQALDVEGPGS